MCFRALFNGLYVSVPLEILFNRRPCFFLYLFFLHLIELLD